MEQIIDIPPRYKITTPLFTPECYFDHPLISEIKVLGLHVPADPKSHPSIMFDYPPNVISEIFGDTHVKIIPLSYTEHAYFDPTLQYTIRNPNRVMTQFMRIVSQTHYGERMADSFYGDAVVFGSYNHKEKYLDNGDNSVPFEIIEQFMHIYEIY